MQIGMFYQIQVPKPWTPTSDFDRYWEMMDQIVLAEELGFESVWLATTSSAPNGLILARRTLRWALSANGPPEFGWG